MRFESFCSGLLFAMASQIACPSVAQDVQTESGLLIGIPDSLSHENYDARSVLERYGTNLGNPEAQEFRDFLVIPRVEHPPGLSTLIGELVASGGCPICAAGGEIDVPLTPLTPKILQGNETLFENDRETIRAAVAQILHSRASLLDSVCMAPFIGSINASNDKLFGDTIRFGIVAPSEIFSVDRPRLWLAFTMTVRESGDTYSRDGGRVGRREFIIDGLRYSRRGFCTWRMSGWMSGWMSGTPLPADVKEDFDDSIRLTLEKQIVDFFSTRLGSNSSDWTTLFQPIQ